MSLARAIETGDLSQLPSRRDEDWRWTDLRGLIRQPLPKSRPIKETIQRGGPFHALDLDEIVFANGHQNWWPDETAEGVVLSNHDAPSSPLMASVMPMSARAAREADDPRVFILEFHGAIPNAAVLRFVSATETTQHSSRLGVVVHAGARATLLESYEGRGTNYLANALVEIFLEEGAHLERIIIASDDATGIAVSSAEVHLAKDAIFSQTVLTSGAKRQRIETRVSHPGAGASARLDGLYLLADKRHTDITTVVTHTGVDGATNQLVKGVVEDQARGVFQGRIVVAPGADKTEARMGHHALILSDRAEVDAKPELEIHADDVVCAHGNTVGALDEEALFYARQRGIPEREARAMLTEAFLAEVVDRIEHEGAREVARAWLADRLGASS